MTAKQIKSTYDEIEAMRNRGIIGTCLTFELHSGKTIDANCNDFTVARIDFENDIVRLFNKKTMYQQFISFESIDRIGVDFEQKFQ